MLRPKEKVFQNRKPGEFVFACEKNQSNSDQTYIAAHHIDFITEYEFTNDKRYHECIFPEEPIKPYLDLESCELPFSVFIMGVKQTLSLLPEYGDSIIFSACREEKCSLHVIYYNYVSTLQSIKKQIKTIQPIVDKYIKELVPERPPEKSIIDMQVYKAGTFRMPYSKSFRSNPHTLKYYNLDTGEEIAEYNREHFKKGILHYFECPGIDDNSTSIKTNSVSIREQTQMYDAILYNWAQKQGWSIVNYKEEDSTIKLLLKGVTCPKIGRVHKSNNFYLRIDLDSLEFPSVLGCLDCECTNVKFDGPKFSTILKPDEIKNQLLLLLS